MSKIITNEPKELVELNPARKEVFHMAAPTTPLDCSTVPIDLDFVITLKKGDPVSEELIKKYLEAGEGEGVTIPIKMTMPLDRVLKAVDPVMFEGFILPVYFTTNPEYVKVRFPKSDVLQWSFTYEKKIYN
jgi:hypothetical protein